MHPLQWEYRPDGLRAPAMICAFKGWNDASDAASTALTFVGSTLGARRFATIDPEEFYDFQAVRPQVKLVEGETRQIVWPAVELYEARVPRGPEGGIGGPVREQAHRVGEPGVALAGAGRERDLPIGSLRDADRASVSGLPHEAVRAERRVEAPVRIESPYGGTADKWIGVRGTSRDERLAIGKQRHRVRVAAG